MLKFLEMNRLIVALLTTLILTPALLSQQLPDEGLTPIRTELQKKIETNELASFAVGIIQDGRTIWKEAFGWADRKGSIRASSETVYPLASLSKSITATAVWKLFEDGKLRLDDPVGKHLKSAEVTYFQGDAEDLKVRHLLNMEGGIPHQFEYFYGPDEEEIPPLEEQIRRFGFTAFPPGRIYHYSNFSMAILEQLIADVSGQSFDDFMKIEIFQPLGMRHTFVERPAGTAIAQGYDSKGNQLPPTRFEPRGGAGMYSTLDDLLGYGLAHLKQKEFLKSATLDLAHQTDPESPSPYYTSGWGVLPTSDGRVSLLSNGAIAGAAATILLIPRENLVIACLTNTSVGNDFTDGAAFRMAGALLEGYSQSLAQLFEELEPLFSQKAFKADKTHFGDWEGQIKTEKADLPVAISFRESGDIVISIAGMEEKAEQVYLEKDLLNLKFKVTIPAPGAQKLPHRISLELMKEGNKLFGIVTAQSDVGRPKFFFPYYIELTRKGRT